MAQLGNDYAVCHKIRCEKSALNLTYSNSAHTVCIAVITLSKLVDSVGCGDAATTGDMGSTPISEVPMTEVVPTSVELPTTTVFLDTRPACEISAVDPNQVNPIGQTVDGLNVIRCIGDWMITQNFPECGECEGITPFHIEDNAWKMYDPMYIYCYSVPDDYGPDPEGTPVDQSNILATIQIAVAGYPCDETNQGYHPESAADQWAEHFVGLTKHTVTVGALGFPQILALGDRA